jgi:putative nucleotide binding protein
MKDEWAIVLDYLQMGHPMQMKSHPVAQVIGTENFNLLEIIPREDAALKVMDKVYIGEGKRDIVRSVIGKIPSSRLTVTAQSELPYVIEAVVGEQEKKFVNFFNNAGSVTMKQHQFELLPGIGKKHMWQIIDERKKKPFESFEDIKKRCPMLPDIKKSVAKRIVNELTQEEKWYIFVSPARK